MADTKSKAPPRRASKSARKHIRRMKQEAGQNPTPAGKPGAAAQPRG